MRLALDTNILRPILSDPSVRGHALAAMLDRYNATYDLTICSPVYAELLSIPGAQAVILDGALAGREVQVDWALARRIWVTAGQAYAAYAQRRRMERPPTEPRRILADFVIGAHALHHAGALLTFNAHDFRASFPTLQVIVPAF